MLPTFLVASAIEGGSLVPLLRDYPLPEAGLYLVRPPGAHVAAKVRAFFDAMVERFGGEPDWDACEMHAARLSAQRRRAAPGTALIEEPQAAASA